MAYINQDRKAELAPAIKSIFKKYGVKGSIAVRHYSTLVVTVKSGVIDFITNFNETVVTCTAKDHIDVNPHWYHDHFTGEAKEFLTELLDAMNKGNHDNSDIQSDYFDVGWYCDVNIGRWDKPYQLTV